MFNMPDKNYVYTIGLDVDAKTLKTAIKNDVRDALKECDKIGDALTKGLSPDTSGLEDRLSRLEDRMGKLHQVTNGTADEFTTMKKAFAGFVELQAKVSNLEDSIGAINSTLHNTTSAIQNFITAFTVNSPEQAALAIATALKHVGDVGGTAAAGIQQMKDAAKSAGDIAKKNTHEILTNALENTRIINGAVDAAASSANNLSKTVQATNRELAKLKQVRESFTYDGDGGQDAIAIDVKARIAEFEELDDAFDDILDKFSRSELSSEEYVKNLSKVIRKGQELIALFGQINSSSVKKHGIGYDIDAHTEYIDSLLEDYENMANGVTARVDKISLKPIKLKVDVSSVDEIKQTINERVEEIKNAKAIKPIKLTLDFEDSDPKKFEQKRKELQRKIDKGETVTDEQVQEALNEELYAKSLGSLKKKAEITQKVFKEANEDLVDDIKQFKRDIDKALTLQFKWDKTDDNAELSSMFAFIQNEALNNPIELFPDTEKLVNDIQTALNNHKFTFELDGDANVVGVVDGKSVPIIGARAPVAGGQYTSLPRSKANKQNDYDDNKRNSNTNAPNSNSTPSLLKEISKKLDDGGGVKQQKPQTQQPITQNKDNLENSTVQENSNAINNNNEVIKSAMGVLKDWLFRQNKSQYGPERVAALSSVGMDFRGLNDAHLYSFVEDLLLNNPDLGDRLGRARVSGSKDAGYIFNDNLINKLIEAQKQLGVDITTSKQEDDKFISQKYLEQAESLARMGNSLNKAYSDLDRQAIPYEKPLKNVIDLFSNNSWIKQWGDSLVQSATQDLDAAKSKLAAAPADIARAEKAKGEADEYAAKMAEKMTQAKAAYGAAEAAYNAAVQDREEAKTHDTYTHEEDSKRLNQIAHDQDKKTLAYSAFKEAERQAAYAKDNAEKAANALNSATSKAQSAQSAVDSATAKLEEAKALAQSDSAFDDVSSSAKDLLAKMAEMTAKYAANVEGGITQYLRNLNQNIAVENVKASNENLSQSVRDKSAQESVRLSGIRDAIINELRPFVENFDGAKKAIVGDIANLLGGYKLEVTFKDSKGNDVIYSFNNAVEGADKESGPYWSNWVDMMNDLRDKEITRIRATSTPNMSDLRMAYDGTMTKSEAVNSVVSAYNQLDKSKQSYLSQFITDMNLFLDEGESASKRWKVIADSFFTYQRYGGKDQLEIHPDLNSKFKSATEKEDEKTAYGMFMRALSTAKDEVNAERRTRSSRQRQMARNVDAATAVVEKPKRVSAAEQEFSYTSEDKQYRTAKQVGQKAIDFYNVQLTNTSNALTEATEAQQRYTDSLESAKQEHSKKYEQKMSQLKHDLGVDNLSALREKYPNIKSYDDFVATQKGYQDRHVSAQSAVDEFKSQLDADRENLNSLYSELESKKKAIEGIEVQLNSVKQSGGLEQYLQKVNAELDELEKSAAKLREQEVIYGLDLGDLDADLKEGKISQEDYAAKRQAIKQKIEDNKQLIKLEREKYDALKKTRDAFTKDTTVYDKEQGVVRQATYDEYVSKKQDDLKYLAEQQASVKQRIGQAETKFSESDTKLKSAQANLETAEFDLQQMRLAFSDMYYEYLTKWYDNVVGQIQRLESQQKTRTLTKDELQELEQLKSKKLDIFERKESFKQIAEPEVTTGYESTIRRLEGLLKETKTKVEQLQQEKQKIEENLARLQSGDDDTVVKAPVESMSYEMQKISVIRDVELINENLELADKKIKEAEDRKAAIKRKIDSLEKYGTKSSFYRDAKAQKTREASAWLEENDQKYQEMLRRLQDKVASGELTRDQSNKQRLDYVHAFKEKDTTGQYKVDVKELIRLEHLKIDAQKEAIRLADEKKKELVDEKAAALAVLGVTEDQLFAERQINKEREKSSQPKLVQLAPREETQPLPPEEARQTTLSRFISPSAELNKALKESIEPVKEQEYQIDKTFLDEIDARVRENDAEIAELRSKINSDPSSSKQDTSKFADHYAKVGAGQIDEDVDKANREFYKTLKQSAPNKKGYTFADFSDVGNINSIISKAKELRAELGKMHKAGQEGTKEYMTVQRQLSKLLETTRKGVSKTALADGYEKNADKTMSSKAWSQFLTDHGGANLTKFTGSKTNIGSDSKFKDSLKIILAEKISGFSEEYQAAAEKAYYDAFNATKAKLSGTGKSTKQISMVAYAEAQKAFETFIKSGGKGFVQGVDGAGDNSPEIEAAKAELLEELAEIEQENKDIRAFRDRYVKGMLSATEEDNDVLIKFLGSPEEMYGVVKQAKDEAVSQIDTAGKTDEQIGQETKELFKKILFRMLTATVIGAREGIDESDDSFDDERYYGGTTSPDNGQYDGEYYGYDGFVQSDNVVLQANNVIVNGNTIGTSGDGSGPWALETTLQETNRILSEINTKTVVVDDNASPTTRKQEEKEEDKFVPVDKSEIVQEAEKIVYDNAKLGKDTRVSIKEEGTAAIHTIEELGNLTVQTLETLKKNENGEFERDVKGQRTSISGKTQSYLSGVNKQIVNSELDKDSSQFKAYIAAYEELDKMTIGYNNRMDQLSEDEIRQWNEKISLVRNLGDALMSNIKKSQRFNVDSAVSSSTAKLQKQIETIKNAGLHDGKLKEDADALFGTISAIGSQEGLDTFNSQFELLKSNFEKTKRLKKDFEELTSIFKKKIEIEVQMIGLDRTSSEFVELAKKRDNLDNEYKTKRKALSKEQFADQFLNKFDKENIVSSTVDEEREYHSKYLDGFIEKLKKAGIYSESLENEVKELQAMLANVGSRSDLQDYITKLNVVETNVQELASLQDDLDELADIIRKIGKLEIQLMDGSLIPDDKNNIKKQIAELYKSFAAKWKVFDENKNPFKASLDADGQLQQVVDEQNDKIDNKRFQRKNTFINKYSDQLRKMENSYNQMLQGLDGKDVSTKLQTQLDSAKLAIDELRNKLIALANSNTNVVSDTNKTQLENYTNGFKKCAKEIQGVIDVSERLNQDGEFLDVFDDTQTDRLRNSMMQLAEKIHGASVEEKSFNDKTKELVFTAKTGKNEITTLTYKFDELTHSVYEVGSVSKKTTGFFRSFFSDVGKKIGELTRYYTGMSLVTEAFQRLRQGVQYIREIDVALTELKKVTSGTDESYNRFLQTMSKTAGIVGSTVSELTNSAAAWSRLGYSMEEAGELAKNTAILLNVSEFESEEQATEALISSLQAFNYEAEDSIKIVDKLNIVGKYIAQTI